MKRRGFMSGLHQALRPRSYLVLGLRGEAAIADIGTPTIAVDPLPKLRSDLAGTIDLVEATSDDFFARTDPIAGFEAGVVDLTFIDGMHIFEFALRDFINAERLSSRGGVVVLNGMLPRTVAEAARNRRTQSWAGDVYKVAAALETYRPDLVVVGVDTKPTGMAVVAGLDPANRVLSEQYQQILAEYATRDPQDVPSDIRDRQHAADPALVLSSPVWANLIAARERDRGPVDGLRSLLELRGTARYVARPAPGLPPNQAQEKTGSQRLGAAIRRRH